MKIHTILIAAALVACAAGAHADAGLPIKSGTSVPCDLGQGVIFQLLEGASITGPVTMTSTSGERVDPDGTKRTDAEDVLSVGEGHTITGPMTICTRTVKP